MWRPGVTLSRHLGSRQWQNILTMVSSVQGGVHWCLHVQSKASHFLHLDLCQWLLHSHIFLQNKHRNDRVFEMKNYKTFIKWKSPSKINFQCLPYYAFNCHAGWKHITEGVGTFIRTDMPKQEIRKCTQFLLNRHRWHKWDTNHVNIIFVSFSKNASFCRAVNFCCYCFVCITRVSM